MATEVELRQAWLALVAAELAGDQGSAEVILRRTEDPGFAFEVAVYAARSLAGAAGGLPNEELTAARSEIAGELYRLAVDGT